ncbi:MAG: MATE family efflux transporter [Butyricicoccus sp.]
MEATNEFLGTEKLGKLMRKFAVPNVISLLVAALYNIVDQVFIANADYLGSYGNAANTVVFPMTVVALAIAMMLGDGCCAFVSISLGAKRSEDAHRSVGTAVISILVSGIVLAAVYLAFLDLLISLFGGRVNAETFRLSKEYFFYIALGVPFYMFGQALNPIIRSDGSPNFAMGTLLAGAIINVIFDPIFIFVFGWGMKGAALATIAGQIISALLAAYYLFHMKAIHLSRDSFHYRVSLLKKMLPLGITSFLAQISIVLSMAAVLNMATKYGARDAVFGQEQYSHIPTAVIGIVMKFFQILIAIAVGISAGCIPIVGYNIGSGRNSRVKQLLKLMLIAEAAVGLIATIIFELFPMQLIGIFGAANESVYYQEFGIKCIRIFLMLVTLSCINKGTFIFLQALGKAKESTMLSMMREILFGVGLPLLLPVFFGLDGVLYFMPAADILTFIASVIVIVQTEKQLSADTAAPVLKQQEPQEQTQAQQNLIIVIGRSYGSGGRSIAKRIAETLDIPYYDANLLQKAAEESGLSEKFIQQMDEKNISSGMIYGYSSVSAANDTSVNVLAYKAQREIIERVAEEGPCVIVGRRADQVLKESHAVLSVFLSASLDYRIQHVIQRDHLTERESQQKILKVDKARAAYYNQISDEKWGAASTYDLCIDTGELGEDGAAELILLAAKQKISSR